jgi:hypothetical protein
MSMVSQFDMLYFRIDNFPVPIPQMPPVSVRGDILWEK